MDDDVTPANLGSFVEELAAAATGPDRITAGAADDSDLGDLSKQSIIRDFCKRNCFGTERQTIAGVLEICARDDAAIGQQDRGSDVEL